MHNTVPSKSSWTLCKINKCIQGHICYLITHNMGLIVISYNVYSQLPQHSGSLTYVDPVQIAANAHFVITEQTTETCKAILKRIY